jgi:hypothetical protein
VSVAIESAGKSGCNGSPERERGHRGEVCPTRARVDIVSAAGASTNTAEHGEACPNVPSFGVTFADPSPRAGAKGLSGSLSLSISIDYRWFAVELNMMYTARLYRKTRIVLSSM